MSKSFLKGLQTILATSLLLACTAPATTNTSGLPTERLSSATQSPTNQDLSEADVVLSFTASLTIFPENTTDFGSAFSVDLPQTYDLPLTVNSEGQLTFLAQEFPRIVYRICNLASTSTRCDYYSDIENIVDMDLVFDSCDRLVKEHSECGAADNTLYTGELNEDGQLHFDNIAIRTRLFFVTTSGSSGYSATPTMAGSIDDLSRISLDLSTESVPAHNMTGEPVDENGDVVILGTGVIPERTIGDLPSLGTSSFVAEIIGEFSENPLDILE